MSTKTRPGQPQEEMALRGQGKAWLEQGGQVGEGDDCWDHTVGALKVGAVVPLYSVGGPRAL